MHNELFLQKSNTIGTKSYRIGIDLMGAELEPNQIFNAIVEYAAQKDSNLAFVIYATPDVIASLQNRNEIKTLPISFTACQEAIFMDEKPLAAVKKKKGATTCVAIQEHAKAHIDACLSCANTGAIVAASTLYLRTLAGIERPCLATCVPKVSGKCLLVDVGARVSATDKQLIEYAYLATSYAKVFFGIDKPRVGLLNIGREFAKGGKGERDAYNALQTISQKKDAPFIFSKNVEPYDVFFSDVDILITNGFCGNILLKSMEATASFIIHEMRKKCVSQELVEELQRQFSQDTGIGGHLLGLNGYVCKCHGLATPQSIKRALYSLQQLLEKNFVAKTEAFLRQHLPTRVSDKRQ